MYHRISTDDKRHPDYYWSVTQSQLRRHLWLLQKWGYTCISFEDHSLSRRGELVLPKKPVILTFDDGYSDVYKYALPVLKEFGVRATVFVLGDRSIRSNSWDYPVKYSQVSLLNDDMIVELHKAGFEIGSHSMTHADLTVMSRKTAWDEIVDSKASLENLLKSPVTTFAYPFGATNPDIEHLVSSAGYEYGCGSFSGPPRFSTDLFNIRRTLITNTTEVVGFSFKMLTPYSHYRWLLWKLRSGLTPHTDNAMSPEQTRSAAKRSAAQDLRI